MGRAARAKQARRQDRIQFAAGDYWKLMKLEADLATARQKAAAILAPFQQARARHLEALAKKYPGFQAENAHYTSDDATCSLVRAR